MEIRIGKSNHHSTKYTVRIELRGRPIGHSISEVTPEIANKMLQTLDLGKVAITIMEDAK